MQDTNFIAYNYKQLEIVKEKLKSSGFQTELFSDKVASIEYILSVVGSGKKVGLGGSQTVRSLGLVERLKDAGNEIITHTSDMSSEERLKVWLEAQRADFYFASPQAITLKGEIFFLDAYGNRAMSVILGPKKVVLIAGYNKIVKDLDTALWRIKNVSAIINNIRLNRQNPCVNTGKCMDCSSSTRICNVLTVLYKKPQYTDYLIILINEHLGY